MGLDGSGDGQFNTRCGVAVDASGNVYVADTGNNRIQTFTSSGTYLTQWGTHGSGQRAVQCPIGVAVDAAAATSTWRTPTTTASRSSAQSPTPTKSTSWGRIKALYR